MRRSAWLWPAFLSAGLLLLLGALPASAETKPYPAFLEGTEVFRRILCDRQFTPLYTFNDLNRDPQHSILIVLGDANALLQVPGGVDQFVKQGGALFLATDRALRPGEARELSQMTSISVSGQTVICHDTDSCYKGFDYCPYLKPVAGANPDLFRNVTMNVASNAPSYLLDAEWSSLSKLALLPEKCSLEGDNAPLPRTHAFAVGGRRGKGRVLVLADHSIFINEMMLPEDNSNVEFTYNCLEWLRGNAQDGRSQVLFVEEDGRINSKFNVPLKEMPNELMKRLLEYMGQHPDEAAKLALRIVTQYPRETAKLALDMEEAADKTAQEFTPKIEQNVREFDDRDGFNAGFSEGALQGLAVFAAVLVVLYGCYRIGWKSRHRSDLQGPLLALTLYRLAPADTVAAQRRRDLIRGDNLWEPARDMARQFMPASPVTPRIMVQGGWLRRWTMTARVRRLWRLAYGAPTRVSLNQWRRLLREAQQVKTALANGAVRFQG